MAASNLADKLVVIVGETASGKSALALELARKFNGEIICADSRTIYKGMDIGTAKPSEEDQRAIPHHLLDIVAPDEMFNVRQFKQRALEVISDITARGKLPILVGGTGLYIDAVMFDYQFSPPGARKDLTNPRHLKYQESSAYQNGPRANTLILGLRLPKDELQSKIEKRVSQMFEASLEQEANSLVQKYGWEAPGLNTIGYQEFRPYFDGEQTLVEVQQHILQDTLKYAKRQRTWFKRNKSIHWIQDQAEAVKLATQFLQN